MSRLTERHCGKAVIKDKSLLPEAMEKLAKMEEAEASDMDEITTKMMEHICDNICKYPIRVGHTQDELEDICAECKMGKFVCDILNTYNRLNDFENTQSCILMKELSLYEKEYQEYGCRDCEYEDSTKQLYPCRVCKRNAKDLYREKEGEQK